MLHKEVPFIRIGTPLCAGIITGLFFHPDFFFYVMAGTFIIISFFISLNFNRYPANFYFGFTFSSAMFLSGLLLYNEELNTISLLEPEEALFAGILTDYPEEKENSYKLILKLDERISRGKRQPVGGSIVLYNKKDTIPVSFLPGDKLTVKCLPVRITSRGNPFEFDYSFYMQCQGTRYYAFTDNNDIQVHSSPERRNLACRALIIRERIINMFRERGLEGQRLALVAAITLGQKNMLDPEQKQHFIKAGVMHIMAVSGLHAVILSLFIFKFLFFLKGRSGALRVLITLVILWLFAFVTGLTPSVLRATLMFSFLQAGNIMKRPVNAVNSVLASAFVLIMIRPSVIFDAGFQLSYAAVIFIVSFYREMYLKVRFRNRIADLIWQSVAVTVIAQAGTLPLTIMLFNRFPVWFILSNVIIVPVSSLVIITGCLVPILYPIKFLSEFLTWFLGHITGLTELLTEKAASLPLSTIDNIGFTTSECILLTITIYLLFIFFLRRKSIRAVIPLISLLLFVLSGTIATITTRNSNELIVYNSTGSTTIGIRCGNILRVYSDTCYTLTEVIRHSSMRNLKITGDDIKGDALKISTGNLNIMVTSILNNNLVEQASPDILILKGRLQIQKDIRPDKEFKAIIVSADAVQGMRFSEVIRMVKADTVHFVRKEGAFFMRL